MIFTNARDPNVFFNKRAILLYLLAYRIGEEQQNVNTVSFSCDFIGHMLKCNQLTKFYQIH